MRYCSLRRCTFLCFALISASLLYVVPAHGHDVFVVDSYHEAYPWSAISRKGFTDNLEHRYDIEFHELNTKRIPSTEFESAADKVWGQIVAHEPDIVVTMDDNALKLLGQRVSELGIPLVFMGINNNPRAYFKDNILPDNVAGVLERPLLKSNANVINHLVKGPNQRIKILLDDGVSSQAFISQSFGEDTAMDVDDIALNLCTSGSYSRWQEKVRSLDSQRFDALVIGSYANLRDDNGVQVSDEEVAIWTSAHSRIPVFTFWSHGVGKNKALGGVVIDGYDQGAQAALMVNRMLTKGSVPHVEVPRHGEFFFSKSELARWNIVIPTYFENRVIFVD